MGEVVAVCGVGCFDSAGLDGKCLRLGLHELTGILRHVLPHHAT